MKNRSPNGSEGPSRSRQLPVAMEAMPPGGISSATLSVPVTHHRLEATPLLLVLACAAGFAASALSSAYELHTSYASFFYLPAGVFFAAALRFRLPGVLATALGLVLHQVFLAKTSVLQACLDAGSDAFAYSLAAFFFLRTVGLKPERTPLRTTLAFYGWGLLFGPLIHCLIETPLILGILAPDIAIDAHFFRTFVLGDIFGVMALAPALWFVGRDFSSYYRGPMAVLPDSKLERVSWLALLFAALLVALWTSGDTFFSVLFQLSLVLYPLLVWSALRLGLRFTYIATALAGLSIFSLAIFGLPSLPALRTESELFATLLLILALSGLSHLLAAAEVERRVRARVLERNLREDHVTGCLNFHGFATLLRAAREQATAGSQSTPLACISLGAVQELLHGYGAGARYELLRQFSRFLRATLPAGVVLARVDGERFFILAPGVSADTMPTILDRSAEMLPLFRLRWQDLVAPIPCGIAWTEIDEGCPSVEELLTQIGGGAVPSNANPRPVVHLGFDEPGDAESRRREARWRTVLQLALDEDRFALFAQPILDLRQAASDDGPQKIICEVLLRLEGTSGDLISPRVFIVEAERLGMMPEIDRWVLQKSLAWLANHQDARSRTSLLCLNVSGQTLVDGQYPDQVEAALARYSIDPRQLCIEITETAAIADLDHALALVERLRSFGVRVVLDDFGTGVSSFEYLRLLPVDGVKIGGVFVRGAGRSALDLAIVEAICSVARAKSLMVCAEYVETQELLDLLRQGQVDLAQGKAIGMPVPIDRIYAA